MNNSLLVILNNDVSLRHFDSEKPTAIYDACTSFSQIFSTNNNGFYDWLRTEKNQIIGVRWSLFDENDSKVINNRLPKSGSIKIEEPYIYIYFGNERFFEENLSNDQSFGENNFYVSDTDLCAISFSTYGLSSKDLKFLLGS